MPFRWWRFFASFWDKGSFVWTSFLSNPLILPLLPLQSFCCLIVCFIYFFPVFLSRIPIVMFVIMRQRNFCCDVPSSLLSCWRCTSGGRRIGSVSIFTCKESLKGFLWNILWYDVVVGCCRRIVAVVFDIYLTSTGMDTSTKKRKKWKKKSWKCDR